MSVVIYWRIYVKVKKSLPEMVKEAIKVRDNEKNDLLLKQTDFKNRLIKRRTSWRCI
ncbi:Uncharacterised protein [Escherichia coli]|nr:Uncharacterised protein [Escherichia coli]